MQQLFIQVLTFLPLQLMVVVGGQAPKAIRSVECYDFKEERWHQVAELPSRRCRAGKRDCVVVISLLLDHWELPVQVLLIRRIFIRKALIKINVSFMPPRHHQGQSLSLHLYIPFWFSSQYEVAQLAICWILL